MDNVKIDVKGDQLIVTVDLTATGTRSASGKTMLVASTRGSVQIPHAKRSGLTLALNVMAKP